MSEGVRPSLIGQSNPGTPGPHTDEQMASWRAVTDAVHINGGRIFGQLIHGGRVSHPDTTGHQPVGPSAVAAVGDVFTPTGRQPAPVPRALDTAEVPEHAHAYAEAARRAIDAGFDGVELHGANGYLISQFLSSNANRRTDRYGGTIAGRIRFAVEAVAATVDAIGAARTSIRLSPGGGFWGVEETDALATPSLRFGDPRVMALTGALSLTLFAVTGITNKSLRALTARLLGTHYSTSQMTYDLRRLRLNGLIRRIEHTHTYILTPEGQRLAIFYTKLNDRLLRPLLAADQPQAPPELRHALATIDHHIDDYITRARLKPAC